MNMASTRGKILTGMILPRNEKLLESTSISILL